MLGRLLIATVVLSVGAGAGGSAEANVIWPAALLAGRMLSWWVIAASLLIEAAFAWQAFRLTPLKALAATIAANAVSAVLGCSSCRCSVSCWRRRCTGLALG